MIAISAASALALDSVILRTGDIMSGKLVKMTSSSVIFESRKTLLEFSLQEVYAVKSDSRGNIYYSKTGERRSRPAFKPQKDADYLYLVDGGEIMCWQTMIDGNNVLFAEQKPRKNYTPTLQTIKAEDVFMILYHDGSSEIVNDVNIKDEPEVSEEIQQAEQPLKVVFHYVTRGETLSTIASKYKVTPEQLREWNELTEKTTDTIRLNPGMQLMIYTTVK